MSNYHVISLTVRADTGKPVEMIDLLTFVNSAVTDVDFPGIRVTDITVESYLDEVKDAVASHDV